MNNPEFVYSKNKYKHWWQKYVWGPDNYTKRVIGLPGEHVKGVIEDGKPVIYINDKKINEPYLNTYPLVYPSHYENPRSYDVSMQAEEQPFYRMDSWIVKKIQKSLIENGRSPMFYPQTPLPVNKKGKLPDVFDVHLKSKAMGDDKDEYWMMGDNRLGSSDCRDWGHPIDGDYIHGRIIFRLFSIDSSASWFITHLIMHPIDFLSRIRWKRWFQVIHSQAALFDDAIVV